jgi:hypothetical protein
MTAPRASSAPKPAKVGNGPRHGPITAGAKSAPALPPYKLLPVSELTPHPHNPRTHTPASISLLCRKIREDG